ncbi:hypothetical protein PMAYCL1PPCAC_09488 [Pristionchus mayeri]|uniref:PDZ domain-containing protein n=1 Tax=Pristionchus mayeri TaxID=1317129 RepID=A0AAN4ZDP7_9BILA|nr:hypothetical protein PMAYCL1PPCAC_09488 [Pristionchus mayeri]
MQLPTDAPQPRCCIVEKTDANEEYGFHLHGEKGKELSFIGEVDKDSPAETAGLRMGDCILEVNRNIVQGMHHKKIDECIMQDPMRCMLLVIDEEGYEEGTRRTILKSLTLFPTLFG